MKIGGVEFKTVRNADPCKTVCNGCPFTYTDESEMISNYGCLPDAHQILEMYLDNKGLWKCHSKDRPCGGLIAMLKENNVPMDKNNELLITEENPLIK
jgi:hypothetical protein